MCTMGVFVDQGMGNVLQGIMAGFLSELMSVNTQLIEQGCTGDAHIIAQVSRFWHEVVFSATPPGYPAICGNLWQTQASFTCMFCTLVYSCRLYYIQLITVIIAKCVI